MYGNAARAQGPQRALDEIEPLLDGANVLQRTNRPTEVIVAKIWRYRIHIDITKSHMPVELFAAGQMGLKDPVKRCMLVSIDPAAGCGTGWIQICHSDVDPSAGEVTGQRFRPTTKTQTTCAW